MLKKINFCTTNVEKLREAKYVFEPNIEIISQKLDMPEIQSLSIEEIAINKARTAFNILKEPIMVDDTGIYFNKYNEFPGTLSKFVVEGIGIDGMLKLLDENDKCFFKTVVVYKDEKQEIITSGILDGKISKNKIGNIDKHIPYRSIFKVVKLNDKLLSECSGEELQEYSHRGQAFRSLKNKLINL